MQAERTRVASSLWLRHRFGLRHLVARHEHAPRLKHDVGQHHDVGLALGPVAAVVDLPDCVVPEVNRVACRVEELERVVAVRRTRVSLQLQ